MADFSTWTALLDQLKDDLSNRDLMVGSYKLPDGREVKYRSAEEFGQLYNFVAGQAESETATSGTSQRAVAMRPTSDKW